ncbi:hypothetical protein AB0L40_07565 [Patulibacter sp. NPDC049589]|uniref:hypothetical protein n=1 Tax=Patulibacter sp. NPDC049589 TaxID=3154731 RepID=UPI00341871FB
MDREQRRWLERVAGVGDAFDDRQRAVAAERRRVARSVIAAYAALGPRSGAGGLYARLAAYLEGFGAEPADVGASDLVAPPPEADADRRAKIRAELELRATVLATAPDVEDPDASADRRLAAALWTGLEAIETRYDALRRGLLSDALAGLRELQDDPCADLALLRLTAEGLTEHVRSTEAQTAAWRVPDVEAAVDAERRVHASITTMRDHRRLLLACFRRGTKAQTAHRDADPSG